MRRTSTLATSIVLSAAAFGASLLAASPAQAASMTTRTASITNDQESATPEVSASVSCPQGYSATGGGYTIDRPQGFTVNMNQPSGERSWTVSVYVPTGVLGFDSIGTVYVRCIR